MVAMASSTAHLAAAQNKKTAILTPFEHDWRWKLISDKSYWYSSVSLFQQEQNGSWDKSMSDLTSFVRQT